MDDHPRELEGQFFQVGDLGRFSMRTIHDALIAKDLIATSEHSSASTEACGIFGKRRPVYKPDECQDEEAEDSDCSWSQGDETGTFYLDIQRRLDRFATSSEQPTMTTSPLSKAQRRFVHATAQIMRLGHASLGPHGKLRSMIIFKDAGSSAIDMSLGTMAKDVAEDHTISPTASLTTKKRRRLERVENGFPCQWLFCTKIFDRASERNKHEQAHDATYTNRFQCPVCGKGFRYPKDVRRHRTTHDKAIEAGTESLPTSFGSAKTSGSWGLSQASLTFSNNTISKDASPVLSGQSGEQVQGLDLEPLFLDGNACMGGVDDWLYDPQSRLGNDEDEDFLEMSRARK